MIDILLRIENLLLRFFEITNERSNTKSEIFEEIWLDSVEVKNLLHIGDMTLFRRRTDGSFVCKRIGRKWYYAKSSIY